MKNFLLLVGSVLIAELAGLIGSFFTIPAIDNWYQYLNKPPLSPPNYLFAPVWTTLYALMGIAIYLVVKSGWRRAGVKTTFALYLAQLVLNVAWSVLFFGLRNPLWALIDICTLWLFIVALVSASHKINKVSAYLLLPYLAWVGFAAALNFSIWQLN